VSTLAADRRPGSSSTSIAIRDKERRLFLAKGGTDMRTTILAYVIAVLGFVTICGGVYSFFDLWNARATLRHYAITIGMICGGLAMVGMAQTLRLLVAIAHAIQPH
jgi:hypothetical protein